MNEKIKTCVEIMKAKYSELSKLEADGKITHSLSPRARKHFEDSLIELMENCCVIMNENEEKEFKEIINSEVIPMACPIKGEFYAYKVCLMMSRNVDCIVKLRIPDDAKRSSGLSNKCRCSKAEVMDIYNPYTGKHFKKARSQYTRLNKLGKFIYEVGKMVEPMEPFEEDRWEECASGIHFFMTEEEAKKYTF